MEDFGLGGPEQAADPNQEEKMKKKHYHRHTAHQIQRLEEAFKECPHPDDKQRQQLSRDLKLAPRQIKFWFQNRRTQLKGQLERADNCVLRAENDKIRCENIAMREALRNIICPNCGAPPDLQEDSFFDERKLRLDNAQLKEELDRVSSIAANYIGRPVTQLPPVQPINISSLDLSMGSFGGKGMHGPSLNLDLPAGATSSALNNLQLQPVLALSDTQKSIMTTIAANAAEEVHRLLQTDEPLWVKSATDGRQVLNLDMYHKMFRRANNHMNPNSRVESSRDSGVVLMNSIALVGMFMNSNTWMELFPTIVSTARTIQVLSPGLLGNQNGALHLMHAEVQVLSPLVPTREFFFLRYCQQVQQGLWIIADVSCDFPCNHQFSSRHLSHRLPSGCLIQDIPNGFSKVIWVERVEIQDRSPPHLLYTDLISSGFAFGAERWIATLQRVCERFSFFLDTLTREPGGANLIPDGKKSMMKLGQRMITNFCATVSTANAHPCTTVAGFSESGIRVTVRKSTTAGNPSSDVVLSAATTIWLPVSPQTIFDFFKDEQKRAQWDVLSRGNPIQEMAHISNGSHPGNCISVLQACDSHQGNVVILQETSVDASGSLLVFCPVELPSIQATMSGQDPSCIPLFPSGFTISPDGRPGEAGTSSSSSHGAMSRSSGSLVTVAFQILVSSLPSSKLTSESANTVTNLITTTVRYIKAALNCPETLEAESV